MISTVEQVLGDAVKQGLIARNVAALVDRLEPDFKLLDTYTEAEVAQFFGKVAEDRMATHGSWRSMGFGGGRSPVSMG